MPSYSTQPIMDDMQDKCKGYAVFDQPTETIQDHNMEKRCI